MTTRGELCRLALGQGYTGSRHTIKDLKPSKIKYIGVFDVPREILIIIALKLNYHDVLMYSLTCKTFYKDVYLNREFWIKKIVKDLGVELDLREKELEKKKFSDFWPNLYRNKLIYRLNGCLRRYATYDPGAIYHMYIYICEE